MKRKDFINNKFVPVPKATKKPRPKHAKISMNTSGYSVSEAEKAIREVVEGQRRNTRPERRGNDAAVTRLRSMMYDNQLAATQNAIREYSAAHQNAVNALNQYRDRR